MWVARDKDEGLYLYENKPCKIESKGKFMSVDFQRFPLPSHLFRDVTFDYSPQEVEIKLVEVGW